MSPGVDGIAQVEPEGLVESRDPQQRLPDAVGHGLAGTLDRLGDSVFRRQPARVGTTRHSEQLSDMKGAAGMSEEPLEIAQALGIPDPNRYRVVRNGPVVPLAAKGRRVTHRSAKQAP